MLVEQNEQVKLSHQDRHTQYNSESVRYYLNCAGVLRGVFCTLSYSFISLSVIIGICGQGANTQGRMSGGRVT